MRSGKVDCEAERSFCRELRISSYPTVMLFLSPQERHLIHTQVPAEVISQVKRIIENKRETFGHDEL